MVSIKNLIDKITPEIRVKVLCEVAFINLITELGYREDKAWTEEENDTLTKLMKSAEDLSNEIIKVIKTEV